MTYALDNGLLRLSNDTFDVGRVVGVADDDGFVVCGHGEGEEEEEGGQEGEEGRFHDSGKRSRSGIAM